MHIIGHKDIDSVLAQDEEAVIQAITEAHVLHEQGETVVPHSIFLRLPAPDGGTSANRIIGLPAHAGGDMNATGMKWIASFPGNIQRDMRRANAVIVLNSPETGQPETLLEGSLISAARTAAGAALAVKQLLPPASGTPDGVSMIGCGVINATVLRYLKAVHPGLDTIVVHDTSTERAEEFARRHFETHPSDTVIVEPDRERAVGSHQLLSIATTAGTPHMDLATARDDAVVLHVSLRDLTVQTVLDSFNVTDDEDHVCREQTSLHLAEQETGGRDFITTRLGQLVTGERSVPVGAGRPIVYSPFGLGVLDMAVARLVRDRALAQGVGTAVPSFLPDDAPLG